MAIANWGTAVIFSVSEQVVFTFKNMNRTVGSDWATHSRIGAKDQVEYLRPKLQKVTFEIALDFNYGVNPRAVIERMERAAELGKYTPLLSEANGWAACLGGLQTLERHGKPFTTTGP